MYHLIYCSTFERKSGYSIQILDDSSFASIKSCIFQLNGIGCGINTNCKSNLMFNTIFYSSKLSDSSVMLCQTSSSTINFHNYSCFIGCYGKSFMILFHNGIWSANSNNISRCNAVYSLHVFDNCVKCNLSFSIFEMNEVGAITVHFKQSSHGDATRCNIINNTDKGNYHFPGMIYDWMGETTISNCYLYNNSCKWLFYSDRGSLTVEDSYIDRTNNYTVLNTSNAQVKSTVSELLNEIYIGTYSCTQNETELEIHYFSEVIHSISLEIFIIVFI